MNRSTIVKFLGVLVVLVSFYFVFDVLWQHRESVLEWRPDYSDTGVFLLCAMVYGLIQFLLSGAWIQLLRLSGEKIQDVKQCHRLYGQTQIAKYIPGNIFHFAGRHFLGREAGYSHVALVGALIYEAIGVVIVASAISVAGVAIFSLQQEVLSVNYLVGILIFSISLFIAGIVLYPRISKSKSTETVNQGVNTVFTVLKKVAVLYAAFFLISGLLFALIVNSQIAHLSIENMGIIVVISVFSWIAGFVTPGSPAGIGVREAVIVVLLAPLLGGSLAVILTLIYRLVTIVGDIVFYLTSRMISTKAKV